jgi:site-specific DNA-methyltransferase (adenine-specific)
MRLIHGEALATLKTLEDASVDAVITDPPYGLGFPYDGYEDTRDNLRRLIAAIFPEMRRVARRVVILPGVTQIHLYPEPDWTCAVCWNTTGSHGKYGFSQWMPILCYGPDVKGFARLDSGSIKSDVIAISGGDAVGFRRSEGEKGTHPCPKPLGLMRKIVKRFAPNPGDLVVDPLMGVGTTALACQIEGRCFVGAEQSARYYVEACRRIAEAEGCRDGSGVGELFASSRLR